MEPEFRVLICHVIEKIKQDESYAGRLGLMDNSKFLSEKVNSELAHTNNQKKDID